MPPTETLAATLKRYRTERGLSQRALADRAKVDHPMISKLESGKLADPGEAARIRIAEALDIPPILFHPDMVEPEPAINRDETVRLLSVHEMDASPLNPRQSFPADEMAELAASIEENGILQNLVARRRGDRYEVIAGGRRLRALQQLVREHRWAGQIANVPVKILRTDDAGATAIALLENLQRADVNPMEEAQALARLHTLDPDTWSTRALAERLGKTPRYVQQRLALVEKLAPAAQAALQAGNITFSQARGLIGANEKVQTKLVRGVMAEALGGYSRNSERDIRARALADYIPVERARFDLADWPGHVVEDADGTKWLAGGDIETFKTMQHRAAEPIATDLKTRFAWVEIARAASTWEFPEPAADDPRPRGAVIEIDYRGEFTVHEGRVRRADAAPDAHSAGEAAAQAGTAARIARERAYQAACEQFDEGLRAELADDPLTALRLFVLGLVAADTPVDVGGDGWPETIAPWLHRLGHVVDAADDDGEPVAAEVAWPRLRTWPESDLVEFLVAWAAGSAQGTRYGWDGGEHKRVILPLARDLAETYGLTLPTDAPVGEPGSPVAA